MITLSGTISGGDLDANSAEETAQLLSNLKAGAKDSYVPIDCASLDVDTAFRDRHIVFTPQTDMELRVLRLSVVGLAATSFSTKIKLEACDPLAAYVVATGHPSLDEYLLDETIEKDVATTDATETHGSLDLRTTSGRRIFLLGGVSYRLVLSSTALAAGPVARANGGVLLRGRRRIR